MPPKKKTSVINQPQLDPPSREPSSVDLGYNFSGNFETDFPEFLEVLGVSPPPHVQMIKLNKDDNEEVPDSNGSIFDQRRPKVYCYFRAENEGKNVNQVITQICVKNFLFGPRESKAFSRCVAPLKDLESVSFIRTGIQSTILLSLALPPSVRYLSIHLNSSDSQLWRVAIEKGVPHVCLQSNSIRSEQISDLASALSGNETLLTLNLNNNPIGDSGAILLAHSLISNKRLGSLSLANCQIGDEAASEFWRVLSKRVEMTQLEIEAWRRQRMDLIISSESQLQLKSTSQKRPGSEHSQTGTKDKKAPRKTTTGSKDDKKQDKKRKSQTMMSSTNTETKLDRKLPKEISVPDETGIERTNGKMFHPGNKSLHHLNFSRNKLSFDSLLGLLSMLDEHGQTEAASKNPSTGLQLISLSKNITNWYFPENSENGKLVDLLVDKLKCLGEMYPKFAEIPRGMEINSKSDTALNFSRQSLNDPVEA